MHDNALAKALRRKGADCVLQPVYTPIRTDEDSIASEEVFFGGVHIYLLTKFPWFRFVPSMFRTWLDRPSVLRLATKKTGSTNPASLGKLAISMLRGEHGGQAAEVNRLTDWLANEMQPDMIVLSNLLIGGSIPTIKRRLPETKLVVLLQGDDIFMDHLPDDARTEVISLCTGLADHVDKFVVNSQFYAGKMASILGIDDDKWAVQPLSIDLAPFEGRHATNAPHAPGSHDRTDGRFRIGYLARVAPEKGLHNLIDAFLELAKRPGHEHVDLHVAGWLGEHNRSYFDELISRVSDAGLSDRFTYHGSPDLDQKVKFLQSLDLLSVPTDYEDPKGLFILEAIASGVPVVQPDHGAFGELIKSTGGGVTYPPQAPEQLSNRLSELIQSASLRKELVEVGRANVRAKHTIELAAERLLEL